MQIAKVIWRTKCGPTLIVLLQKHTEVIISHVRGEIIPYNTINALVSFPINNTRLQYLNQWERITTVFSINIHLNRDNFKHDSITVAFGIIPMRQRIKTIVNHVQGVTQILLATLPSSQISKIGCGTRIG